MYFPGRSLPIQYQQLAAQSRDDYTFIKEVGRGASGITYLAKDKLGKEVAIKIIPVTVDLRIYKEEVEAYSDLSPIDGINTYVPKFYTKFFDLQSNPVNLFIVTEYIQGTNMYDFLIDLVNGNRITPNNLRSITLQLILGLKYIHSKRYAHGDIKPENILIDPHNKIKYIDFGASCSDECEALEATLMYTSPESIIGTMEHSLRASQAQDCWSLAVILFQMYNRGKFPYNLKFPLPEHFTGDEITELRRKIMNAPQHKSNYMNDDGRTNTFLSYILINDPKVRPTITQILDIFLELIMCNINFSDNPSILR